MILQEVTKMDFQKLHIDQPNRANIPAYHVANNERLATPTGVVFLGNNQLVVIHLAGQSMHLFEYNPQDYCPKQIDIIDTVYNGKLTITDLIDFDGTETILTSNFNDGSGSLYRVKNNKLSFIKDLPLPEDSGKCHGGRFYNESIACLTTNANKVFFLDISSSSVVAKFDMPYYIKDICFLNSDFAVAAFALGSPTVSEEDPYASGLLYFSLNLANLELSIIDKLFLSPCAFDAICVDSNTNLFYVTDQNGDRLIVAEIIRERINIVGEICGFDFPHGVDVNEGKMAITNYGNSTFSIFDIGDAQLSAFSGKSSKHKPYRKGDMAKLLKYHIRRIRDEIIWK